MWIPELEGLRGFASLWVFFGHVCILAQCHIPILGSPSYGVDMFILLSGFLMAKNYMEREREEPWNSLRTAHNFWIRRFFRIAPLYYVLLFVALYIGPDIGGMRAVIGSVDPSSTIDLTKFYDQTLTNTLIHMSLLFGFFPYYSANTALPDWSISLEFQYYFLFPLIMFFALKFGFRIVLVSLAIISSLLFFVFPGFYMAFSLPSFIFLKLPIFIAGMFIYSAIHSRRLSDLCIALSVITFSTITGLHINVVQFLIQFIMCLMIFYIASDYNQGNYLKNKFKWIFNNKLSLFLGDVSYSVYLIHLLIVIPVAAYFISHYSVQYDVPLLRFFKVLIVSIPIVYFLSVLTYLFIERPGVKFGKRFINKVR